MKNVTRNTRDNEYKSVGMLGFFIPVPDHIDQIELTTANVAYTIPADAERLVFSTEGGVNFACRENGVATYPVAGLTNGLGSQINPAGYDVIGTTTIGFIGKVAGPNYLSIAVYK